MEKIDYKDYIHGGTQKDFYEESDREYCICPNCEQDSYDTIDSEFGLSIVKCSNCDLIYTNPRAKDSEENYFGDPSIFYDEARLIFKGKKVHHRDRNYIYELKKIKKVKKNGKLLDVGTNMGFFLRIARDMGFETEGVEPSPSLSEIARKEWGLNIHTAFLEEADLPKKNYDIITLIDVFEHVTNPKKLLETSFELLNDDGIVAIKVPNGNYNHFKMKLAKALGKKEGMDIWDCCEHVSHYTPKTFKNIIESVGFEIKKSFIPLPIHSPRWANLVGHYYLHPSPYILDWKRILLRNLFYYTGKLEYAIRGKSIFGPDLMFIIQKKK